jgi:hypothetical protein
MRSLLTGIRTGIGPEVFAWKTADGNYSGTPPTKEKEAYYQVVQTRNALRYRAAEIVFRHTDTTRTRTIVTTTSGPRFWNQTSLPGEQLVT